MNADDIQAKFGVDSKRLGELLEEIVPIYQDNQNLDLDWNRKSRAKKELTPILTSLIRANELWKRLPQLTITDVEEHVSRTQNGEETFDNRLQSLVDDLCDFDVIFDRDHVGNPGTTRTGPELSMKPIEIFVCDLMSVWPHQEFGYEIHSDTEANEVKPVAFFMEFVWQVAKDTLFPIPSLQALSRAIWKLTRPLKGPSG